MDRPGPRCLPRGLTTLGTDAKALQSFSGPPPAGWPNTSEAATRCHMIERKFGPPSESVRTRIASADPETLLAWSERILTADSVDAVLH